jgi:hypothetical protein
MNGLREMIKTRGTIEAIRFPILRKLLLAYDYQIASTYECELFLHSHHASEPIPMFSSYPEHLDSPLLQSSTRFINKVKELDISPEAAQLLDDMRFLTTSVLSLSSPTTQNITEQKAKFRATVKWIHERLLALSAPSSPINIDPSLAAPSTIYTLALLHRMPLSMTCTPALLMQLWSTMWRVPLPTWKKLPGIFFWVLLVANPFARDRPEGRFLKGLMPSCLVAIGMEGNEEKGWDLAMAEVRGFMQVQRWLGGVEDKERERRGSGVSFGKGGEVEKAKEGSVGRESSVGERVKEKSVGRDSNPSTEPEKLPEWAIKE